jgi:hypothetical protein
MMDVIKLYPQYNIVNDRRVQAAPVSPVSYERRSGNERRDENRLKLDTTLTRDIFEIKGKVAQLENSTQKIGQKGEQKNDKKDVQGPAFTQNISKAAQNSIKTDQFIKTTKPNTTETPKEIAKSKSQVGATAGLIAVVLGGTLAAPAFGIAGVGIAIGLGAFLGAKLLRSAITTHIKNKNK